MSAGEWLIDAWLRIAEGARYVWPGLLVAGWTYWQVWQEAREATEVDE